MFNFFRKIRLRFLSKKSLGKYLLYAIGEILLVVMGILIAVQINNLNEVQKSRQKEIVLLSEMHKNLNSDLEDLERNIAGNIIRLNSNEIVRNAIENKQPFTDSMEFHFGHILGSYLLNKNTAAWETLQSVGTDLISDDSLRFSISNLYSNRYQYLERIEVDLDNKYNMGDLYVQILEHLVLEGYDDGKARPRNYENLLQDHKFIEVVKMNISIRKIVQALYEEIRDLIVTLIVHIEEQLRYINTI